MVCATSKKHTNYNISSWCSLGAHIYLAIVHQLVAIVFALVRTHQEHQFVFLQKRICHIRPEVRSGAAQSIRLASLVVLRIAPKDVKHLRERASRERQTKN